MKSHKRYSFRWLYRWLVATVFVFCVTVLIASANGYLFNARSLVFEPTSTITLATKQQPVTVTLNGKSQPATRGDVTFNYLRPGRYTIEVAKDGYITWSQTDFVGPGQAISHPFVRLFLADAVAQEAAVGERITLAAQPLIIPAEDSDIDVRGNELWVKPIIRSFPVIAVGDEFALVGRYASPPHNVAWYPGKTHIVMQLGDEIHIVDRDGGNDVRVATLTTNNPTTFMVTDNGKYLIYRDGDTVYRRQLI